ncbi:MAG TPA: SGNH/GDSL hydrolase family protein [Candidatus Binataceae bacterium]|jgi:lysophospholipase L1-like esterase
MEERTTRPEERGWVAKVAHLLAVLWIQIGLTLVLFWLVSMTAGAVVKRIRRARDVIPAPQEAYPAAPWAAQYFKSLNRVHMRWYPYAYWKATPMSSPYLNIDADGNRVTWRKAHPAGAAQRPVLRLFMLGGSTLWGTGVRDDHTLASLLARRFSANPDYDVEVTNLGQIGYVTTQELLLLYQLLRRGQRPDLVLFYDGVNEAFTGYQNGMGGLTQSEFFRAQEFSILGSSWGRKTLYRTALRSALMSTGLADLVKLMAGKDNPNMIPHEVKPLPGLTYLAPPQDFEGTDAVERDVADIYLFNVQMVRMLAERFKFRSLFYWQPTVFSKNQLAPFERQLLPGDPMRAEFFRGTYQRVAEQATANGIIDISGILNNRPRLDFIDPYHLNESANEIVANRMAADAGPMLDQIARGKSAAARARRSAAAARAAAGRHGLRRARG